MTTKVYEEWICPGRYNCSEVEAIGEYPFHSEVEFNMAVWEYCEKCEAKDKHNEQL